MQPREVLTPLKSVAHLPSMLVEAGLHPSSSKGCTNYSPLAIEVSSYRFMFSTAGVEAIQPEASSDGLIPIKHQVPLLGQGLQQVTLKLTPL